MCDHDRFLKELAEILLQDGKLDKMTKLLIKKLLEQRQKEGVVDQ